MKYLIGVAIVLSTSAQAAPQDSMCLSKAIYAESNTEPLAGQMLVGKVVLNRAKKSGKDVCSVVKARKQFSFYKGGRLAKYSSNDITDKLAKKLLAQETTTSYTHFYHVNVKPAWRTSCRNKQRVGKHIYCTIK